MSIVLVTGCSSGFGELAALGFARNNDTVYATVRNLNKANRLRELARANHLNINIVTLDVCYQNSINSVVEDILRRHQRIDVLINNAGIAIPGTFEGISKSDFLKVFDTNFWGVINLTRSVLPAMRQQRSGAIIMLSSLSALHGLPCDAAYSASKAALERATESLYYEVKRLGIKVCMIEPGAFKTAMQAKMAANMSNREPACYAALLDFHRKKIAAFVEQGDDPNLVAKLIVEIAYSEQSTYCYQVGAQAHQFVKDLRSSSDADRERMLSKIAGVDWWLDGRDKP